MGRSQRTSLGLNPTRGAVLTGNFPNPSLPGCNQRLELDFLSVRVAPACIQLRKGATMPVRNYGVLKGHAIGRVMEFESKSPHYQIHLKADGTDYRIAVNVKSSDPKVTSKAAELLFLVDEHFTHQVTQELPNLPEGFTPLEREPGGLALDYIRSNLFKRQDMQTLPFDLPGEDNDLNEKLDTFIKRALNDSTVDLYAFGSRFGPEKGERDKVFKFDTGNGIHNIHMNQGNPKGNHDGDNGVYQDGALFIHFTQTNRWVAIFLAFQSQAWHTNDKTGHPETGIDLGSANDPNPSEPDHQVRIVAALVNPPGADPGLETVTLLNTTPEALDLNGWMIADRFKHKQSLTGTLKPNSPLVITLSPDVQLGNKGGIITLLNPQGLKVDGVSYTAADARVEGRSVVF